MDSYSVQAVLTAIDKNFTSTMQNAQHTMGELNGAAQKSKTSIMRIAAGIGVFKLVSKAVGAVTSQVGSAIHRFDTLNNYPKIMKNLGYSAEDAASSLEKIKKGLKGLPTSTDQMASAVQKIAPLTGSLDKATDVALALNNALLAGGKSADIQANAMEQYSQMLAAGKVDMQAWRSMLNAMPGQLDQLAQSLLGAGKGQTDLYKAMQDGTISFDDFNEALLKLNKEGLPGLESFEKQAKDAIDGVETAIANFNTAITRGLANSMTAIDDALKKNGFPTIAQAINQASGYVDEFFGKINSLISNLTIVGGLGEKIGAVLGGAFAAGSIQGLPIVASLAKEKFDMLGPSVKRLADSLKGIGKTDAYNKLREKLKAGNIDLEKFNLEVGKLEGGGSKLKVFGSKVKESFGKIKNLIPIDFIESSRNAITEYGQTWKNALKVFADDVPIVGKLGEKFKSLGGKFGKVGELAKTAFGKISGPLGKIGTMAGKIGGTFASKWGSALSTVGKIAFKAIAPAALIGAAVAGLGIIQDQFAGEIYELTQKIKTEGPELIKNFADGIISKLPHLISAGSTLIHNFAGAIAANIPTLIQSAIDIITTLVNGITANAPMLLESAMMIISSLAISLLEAAPQLLTAGLDLLMALIDGLTNSDSISTSAGDILNTLVSSISSMIDILLESGPEIIVELVEGIVAALPGLISAAIEILLKLANSIVEHLPELLDATVQIITAICQGIAQNLPALVQGAIQIIITLVKGIIQNLPKIIQAAKQIITTIGNTLKSLASQALQWGKDIIHGIANGIRSAIGNIASAASSVGSKIKEYLGFSRPDKGPLHWYEKWMPDMMQGLARGITNNLAVVQSAANQVADVIASAQAPFGNGRLAYSAAVGGDITFGIDIAALAARPIVVDNSIMVDGREMAKGTTSYIQTEMASQEKLASYIRGVR